MSNIETMKAVRNVLERSLMQFNLSNVSYSKSGDIHSTTHHYTFSATHKEKSGSIQFDLTVVFMPYGKAEYIFQVNMYNGSSPQLLSYEKLEKSEVNYSNLIDLLPNGIKSRII